MPAAGARLGVEVLEGRDCPAVKFFNGILTVTGTSGADTLVVTRSGAAIAAEGQSFNAASVARIVVTGQGGNDTIHNNTGKPASLFGGFGDDTIAGGWGADRIYGGNGADVLKGNGGDDTIYGGGGIDAIDGGGGANIVEYGSRYLVRGNTAIELEIIRLVNVERAAARLPALTVNYRLNAAANLHSMDMVRISGLYGPYAAHQHALFGTARPQVSDRFDAVGYDSWNMSYALGENIAYGFPTAAAVVKAWMNSPGHRANILSPNFREIGVAVGVDAFGRLFFTQNFGYQA
jgi:uncharacterized protein YkwD